MFSLQSEGFSEPSGGNPDGVEKSSDVTDGNVFGIKGELVGLGIPRGIDVPDVARRTTIVPSVALTYPGKGVLNVTNLDISARIVRVMPRRVLVSLTPQGRLIRELAPKGNPKEKGVKRVRCLLFSMKSLNLGGTVKRMNSKL